MGRTRGERREEEMPREGRDAKEERRGREGKVERGDKKQEKQTVRAKTLKRQT
jgi:hypothetical protein